MNAFISLCNQDFEDKNLNLQLPYQNFYDLWTQYLNLPMDRKLFSPKEVINAIDDKLGTSYQTNESGMEFLEIIKKLEDICMTGLVYQDTLCVKVQE